MNKLVLFIGLAFPLVGLAQADWENPKGAIKDEEVVIEKDKQITLPVISRRFEAITVDLPQRDTTAVVSVPVDLKLTIPKIPVKLRPRTMKEEPLQKTYWGTFKVGYGSYISPYLQADVATKRSDEYALAAHFRHFSSKNGPVDKDNSGLSLNDAFVDGKLFLNKATVGGHVGGQWNTYHLYGYESDFSLPIPEASDIRQRLSNFSLGASLADNDKNEDFSYSLKTGLESFSAKDQTWKENDFYVGVSSSYRLSDDLGVKVDGELHTSKQEKEYFSLTTNRLYYKIKPVVTYSMSPLEFELGLGVFGTKDSINSFNNKFYITPHVVARYKTDNGHVFSAGLTGDVKWYSARMRFEENPYLSVNTVVNNDVKPIDFFINSEGRLIPKLTYKLGYDASLYKQIGQFANEANPSTFDIIYGTGNNLIHTLSARLDFSTSKNLSLRLFGNYYLYSFDNNATPLHLPKVESGLKAQFSLEDKLKITLGLTYVDGLEAREATVSSTTTVTLNPIFDLNLGAEYKINSMVSLFVKMENIIGNQYQYYYMYPSKGFQVLGGIRFTF